MSEIGRRSSCSVAMRVAEIQRRRAFRAFECCCFRKGALRCEGAEQKRAKQRETANGSTSDHLVISFSCRVAGEDSPESVQTLPAPIGSPTQNSQRSAACH